VRKTKPFTSHKLSAHDSRNQQHIRWFLAVIVGFFFITIVLVGVYDLRRLARTCSFLERDDVDEKGETQDKILR
jgi:hypothetical protein